MDCCRRSARGSTDVFRTLYVTTTVVAAIVAILAGILPWACRRTRVDRHAARFRYCVPRRSCAARDPTRYRPLVLSAHGLSRGAGGRTLRRATDAGPAKRHLAMADPRALHLFLLRHASQPRRQ